jgi:hypothetical protein
MVRKTKKPNPHRFGSIRIGEKDRASPRLARVDGNQNHEHLTNKRNPPVVGAKEIIGWLLGVSTGIHRF